MFWENSVNESARMRIGLNQEKHDIFFLSMTPENYILGRIF